MYAYAHITTHLSQLKLSQTEFCFHTHPPSTFFPNLTRSKSLTATYCDSLLPRHEDLNSFFHSLKTKPNSPWLLSAEYAMIEI